MICRFELNRSVVVCVHQGAVWWGCQVRKGDDRQEKRGGFHLIKNLIISCDDKGKPNGGD